MKTLFLLCALVGIVWLGFAPAAQKIRNRATTAVATARVAMSQNATSTPSTNTSAESRDTLRKFELTLESVRPGGTAIATGCYYDVPPSVTTSPERLRATEGKPVPVPHILITGLPDGVANEQTWSGWLIPNGTTNTYQDAHGGAHAVPSYRVALAPPTVENKPKTGAWMTQSGRTALDRPTH